MAIAITVLVGDSADLIPEIIERTKKLSVGPGVTNADICPMNNKAAMERAVGIINKSESQGGKILLDGRNLTVAGFENGNF